MSNNDGDSPLFTVPGQRRSAGRIRRGLDADIRAARDAGAPLTNAGIASLRSMADQLDVMAGRMSKPYDGIPYSALLREFRETYSETFAALAAAEDPLTRALADFLATDAGHSPAPAGDPAGPLEP